jgi:hypothetical protein
VELSHNAAEVAGKLEEAAGELADLEDTNADAGRLALEAIDRETPRRTGTLAAGARCVADPFGFTYVNATPYAVIVDTNTGFASDTLAAREAAIAAVYENHNVEALASLT